MRVAISSTNRLFREGLACILSRHQDFEVIALARSPRQCIAIGKHRPVQVIVLDSAGVSQGELNYMLGQQLYHRFGLVLLVDDGQDTDGFEIVVPYGKASEDLARAVRKAVPTAPARKRTREMRDPEHPMPLSPKETEIAELLGKGQSNRAIAGLLGLKETTVKNFVRQILRKLGCNNRVQVALALKSKPLEAER